MKRPLPMMKFARATTVVLRVLAVLQCLTGFISIMPLEWIARWHRWLGFGALPDDPVLRYVIRGGALVQAAIGVLIWIIASDIVRYRPLVLALGGIYLVCGPAFYLLDTVAGMPWYWAVLDGAACAATGTVILGLSLPVVMDR